MPSGVARSATKISSANNLLLSRDAKSLFRSLELNELKFPLLLLSFNFLPFPLLFFRASFFSSFFLSSHQIVTRSDSLEYRKKYLIIVFEKYPRILTMTNAERKRRNLFFGEAIHDILKGPRKYLDRRRESRRKNYTPPYITPSPFPSKPMYRVILRISDFPPLRRRLTPAINIHPNRGVFDISGQPSGQ